MKRKWWCTEHHKCKQNFHWKEQRNIRSEFSDYLIRVCFYDGCDEIATIQCDGTEVYWREQHQKEKEAAVKSLAANVVEIERL